MHSRRSFPIFAIKYYYFGSQRIAARIGGTTPSNGTLFYMQADNLGSSSLVMTSGGALNTRQTYYPFGAQRSTDGSAFPTGMDYTFTGQKNDATTGLMYYGRMAARVLANGRVWKVRRATMP